MHQKVPLYYFDDCRWTYNLVKTVEPHNKKVKASHFGTLGTLSSKLSK